MLLDTHVLLWVLDGGTELGSRARAAIAADEDPCFSPISIAEVRIKQQLGTIRVPDDLVRLVERAGFREVAFSAAAADRLRDWPALVRHDPFDRLLLAQAVATQSVLVTADRVLLGLEEAPVLDARR